MQKEATELIESVLSSTATGAENARSSRSVMSALGLSDERHFRQLVEKEREQGALILANGRGLFFPSKGEKGRQELIRYVRMGEARIKGQARALRPARQELKRLEVEGQTKLGEDGGECGEA